MPIDEPTESTYDVDAGGQAGPADDTGRLGGGAGRRDEVGRTGVYRVSDPGDASPDAPIVPEGAWGQGRRAAAGDSGSSESGATGDTDERSPSRGRQPGRDPTDPATDPLSGQV